MKVLMIGGTGYLGYFSVWELVERGHQVIAVGLPPAPEPGYLPDSVTVVLQNMDDLSDPEVLQLIDGCDGVVYGGGADGRNTFPPPAILGYRQANVDPIKRLIPLMQQVGSQQLTILGSYYTALDRTFPSLRIAERHPYVTSRLEQSQVAFELAGGSLAVAILELPYIFGAAPNRGTLWGSYIKQIQAQEVVDVPSGGTACVTARQVGWSVAAACERVQGHKHYAIVEDNLTYGQIYGLFAEALNLRRSFQVIPLEQKLASARQHAAQLATATQIGGYDPVGMAEMQATLLYLDPLPAREALGYGHDDLAQAIQDTVTATLKHG
jgi:nucleoside-diphosphate-sugar epimerase